MATVKKQTFAMVQVAIVILTVAFATLPARYISIISVAENWASDMRFSIFNTPSQTDNQIVIVRLTEETLAKLPYRSPVDRGFLADKIRYLQGLGIRAIGLDILFDQPTEADKDARLQTLLQNSDIPIITGWTDPQTGLTEAQYDFQKEYLQGVASGFSNLFKDPVDGTVRNIFIGKETPDGFKYSFASEIAKAVGAQPLKESVRIQYRSPPDADTPAFPMYTIDVIEFLPKEWFKDKIVMIGADLPFGDRHRTPFAAALGPKDGVIPGVIIQSHMLSQIIEDRTEKGTSLLVEIAIATLLGILAAILVFAPIGAALRVFLSLAGVVAITYVIIWLFSEMAIVVPMLSPLLAYGTAIGLGSAYSAYQQKQHSAFVQDAFNHYLSPAMVDQLVSTPDQLKLGGETKVLTLLFCDVRGFTTISEQYDAEGLTRLINRMLTPLTDQIMTYRGTIDKYMGDCIMAFWNAPLNDPEHAKNACISARRMLDEMVILNATLEEEARQEGKPFIPLKVGIGLNSGECVVGNMGSQQRFDYSVLGDTVNLASRLEGQSKTYGVDVVISQETLTLAPDQACVELDLIQVKGKTQAVRIYTLLGGEELAHDDTFITFKTDFETMLANYRAQNWKQALIDLQRARDSGVSFNIPGLFDLYEERIHTWQASPPSPDWDGVFRATTK